MVGLIGSSVVRSPLEPVNAEDRSDIALERRKINCAHGIGSQRVAVAGRASDFPPVRDAGAKEDVFWFVTFRQRDFGFHNALFEPGLRADGNRPKGGGGAFEVDNLAVFQPAFGRGKAQPKGFRFAVVV